MSIIRIGSNEKYADNWEKAFGKQPGKKKAASGTKEKAAAKKKPAAKKKDSVKKKKAKR